MRLIDIEAPCKIEIELYGEKCHATVTANTVDAVPVVRCKDCKHWHGKVNDAVAECDGVIGQLSTTPEFFCAYGEKNDDNNE